MSDMPIIVRPFETAAERDAFYLEASLAFNPGLSEEERASNVANRRLRAERAPDYDPALLRGAFRGETFLGGYRIQERRMQIGAARLLTCCIGSVVTHHDRRLQGAASALLRDATAFARSRQNALLLLDGIAHFYHRFGYSDMFDLTDHTINRAVVLALPASPVTVRLATLDDAPALLALYQRHYGPYAGSFDRTAAEYQRLMMALLSLGMTIALAVDSEGQPCGSLYTYRAPDQRFALEAAADTWPAALALLQYHAHLLDALPEPAAELCWRMPPDSGTLYLLADHLSVSDTSDWEVPVFGWSIRSQTYHHPDAGWMARVASLPALAQALLPEWQERWQRSGARWSGALTLAVDGETCALGLEDGRVRVLEEPPAQAYDARLSLRGMTQALFGYRPLAYIAAQSENEIPAEVLPVLDALFPPVRTCIAGTDDF